MPNLIKATVSKKELRLIPDIAADSADASSNSENVFDVTIVNESDKFASFCLELTTIGADADSNIKWYNLNPEVSVKKPPGASTTFRVVITKSPIQVYDTTIDLTLRVFSVEFSQLYTSQKLRLTIEPARRPLKLYLPVKDLKVFPGDEIEIPVIVSNLSPKATTVTLNLSGIEQNWITKGTTQSFQIDAGDAKKTSFWCQPPRNYEIISQKYDFTIEAKSDTSTSSRNPREQGTLEVLPQGTVEFSCNPKVQRIPRLKGKTSEKKSKFATYELQFENNSNLPQQVDIQVSETDQKQGDLVIPESISLEPGEAKSTYLKAKKRRPWWWLKRRLFFEVSPSLTAPDTGFASTQILPHPSTQVLELQVLPIIPIWLQFLGLLLTLLLLWLLWYLQPQDYHQGPVHSVRLIGNSGLVVSGSSDQTIRLWQVDRSPWKPDIRRLKYEGFIADKTEKAVRVLRQTPREDYVIAAGLESGDIKLWNVLTKIPPQSIYTGTDRVFDLAFTKDSRYLFSGHGSGIVRQWNMEYGSKNPRIADAGFTIYALSLSENQEERPNTLVVVGGRYNKLALWDWINSKIYQLKYQWQDWKKERKFDPVMGQNQYIDGLAIADQKNLLASSDNEGYITLWSMNAVRQCIRDQQLAEIETGVKNEKKDGVGNTIVAIECDNAILDQWRDGHNNQPVRSVALTQNGCYLASVGDDGKVMLWELDNRMRSRQNQNGKIIASSPGIRLNSVDIKAVDDYLLIATGDDRHRVRLYRIQGIKNNDNANCK